MSPSDRINVKVCFVMDCTASMGPWIRQAKTRMVEIVESVRRQHPNTNILAGFVGYRDYGDEEQHIVIPFQSADATMHQIQPIQPEGGDDCAEDVAHALFRALHMDWNDAQVKIVFHIADAPAHGMDFHGIRISDRFPRGDPHGIDPRDSVEKMSFLNMDFTFVKINESTDTMIDQFHNCYGHGGTFSVIDLYTQGKRRGGDPVEMHEELSRAVTRSITNYISSQE